MGTVGIDATDTELGHAVAALSAVAPGVDAVVPVGVDGPVAVDDLVLLAPGVGADVLGTTVPGTGVAEARALLARTAARHVVVLSSATVYGAHPDAPVPLVEDAPLRPSPGARHAEDRAALERVVGDWARQRPGTTVTVLRPTVCVAPSLAPHWLERSAWHARSLRQVGRDRPAQYLHLTDLARAVEHARRHRLDGEFNVAPDGWLTAREQLELAGSGRPPRVTAPVAAAVTRLRWWLGLGTTPPDLAPYTRWPWVVANDRLRATGWAPELSNEEAFVIGHRPGWWSTLTPDRRQIVALGGAGLGAVTLVALATGAVRAALRRRAGRRSAPTG